MPMFRPVLTTSLLMTSVHSHGSPHVSVSANAPHAKNHTREKNRSTCVGNSGVFHTFVSGVKRHKFPILRQFCDTSFLRVFLFYLHDKNRSFRHAQECGLNRSKDVGEQKSGGISGLASRVQIKHFASLTKHIGVFVAKYRLNTMPLAGQVTVTLSQPASLERDNVREIMESCCRSLHIDRVKCTLKDDTVGIVVQQNMCLVGSFQQPFTRHTMSPTVKKIPERFIHNTTKKQTLSSLLRARNTLVCRGQPESRQSECNMRRGDTRPHSRYCRLVYRALQPGPHC